MKYDILFTGDTFLQNREEGEFFSPSVKTLFSTSRNVCINLETTVGTGTDKVAKAFNFQAKPEALDTIKRDGVNITSVANNHSLDYNVSGFEETLHNLRERELNIIGSISSNLFEDPKLNCCVSAYFGNGGGYIAPNKLNCILEDIRINKKNNKYVIVCLHWGEEYSAYPKPRQQQMARQMIDSGADIIIGHHPHVMQGIERYKSGLIFYSLGNFNFNVEHPYHDKLITTKYAYCVGLNMTEKGIEYDIIPIHINNNYQPEVISEKNEIVRHGKYLDNISKPLEQGKLNIPFYYGHSAKHIFHNYYPSWHKMIKEQGFVQVKDMIRWHISPVNFVYYAGLLISPFCKNIKY